MSNKCVFFDRDGVINYEKGYVHKIDDFEFMPDVFDCMRRFQDSGFSIVIITNQAGIGRGYYTEKQFEYLCEWMKAQLSKSSIFIDGIYFCPHHPTHGVGVYNTECNCRKPKPGMVLQAQKELCLNLSESILIGDKVSDVLAGKNAGVGRNYLVETGHSLSSDDKNNADGTYANLSELCESVLD